MNYLFWCAFDHLKFRVPEFESICKLLNIPVAWVFKNQTHPWITLKLNSDDDARQILSRSISTKHCIKIWAQGEGYKKFHDCLNSVDFSEYSSILGASNSYKIHVDVFMKKLSLKERIARIESVDRVPCQGRLDLINPDVEYSYLEFWGLDNNNLSEEPRNIFFGFKIGDGQRHLITKQSIKTRKFIGNTTMDAQLALLMANLGLVKEGKFVLDPFVGTGSLLIAAAQFKGLVFGADINLLTLNAKNRPSRVGEKVRGEDESMIANFEQYGLTSSYGDVIACDFSKSPWRQDLKFDCIITDPPYGIREQIRSVRRDLEPPEGGEGDEVYSLENILQDLLNFSADRLCLGGRLVYWIPIIRQEYKEELLPTHPCLKLVYNCEQVLTAHTSRRLLVMEKIIENTGTAQVHGQLTKFKDQFYIRW